MRYNINREQIAVIIVAFLFFIVAIILGQLIISPIISQSTEIKTTSNIPRIESGDPENVGISTLDIINLLALIVGIGAKHIWDVYSESNTIKIEPSRIFLAVIVSPIVYVGVVSQLPTKDITLLGICIAFQNGFFWQSAFESARTQAVEETDFVSTN